MLFKSIWLFGPIIKVAYLVARSICWSILGLILMTSSREEAENQESELEKKTRGSKTPAVCCNLEFLLHRQTCQLLQNADSSGKCAIWLILLSHGAKKIVLALLTENTYQCCTTQQCWWDVYYTYCIKLYNICLSSPF